VGENLLTLLRDGQLTLNPEITTGLLGMVDAVRQMLKEIASTGQDGEEEYPELRETLTRLLTLPAAGSGSASAGASMAALPDLELISLPELTPAAPPVTEICSVKSAIPEPQPTMVIQPPSDPSPNKPSLERIGGLLVERGQAQESDIVLALEDQRRGDRRRLGEILIARGSVKPEDVLAAQQTLEARARDAAPESIRVGVNLLDKLMTLVGELVLARNQLVQLTNALEDGRLQAVSERMSLIATELQEQVMKTRMQPIGNIWGQFPRTVRDVAVACGKEVEIEMEGKETELDKTIIEAIKDPLTHLVRNSVDHGIELPEARLQAGKDRVGRLILRAFHEGGQVNIAISDDGAGLNAERIRKKAIERALITPEQSARMTEREIFNLIFLPGFSTAEKVTNVSGRGVGMDVVKTNVEKIGGTVAVQSSLGQGTTIRVKIPLTLAIIPALFVTCGGDRYAIPQVNLLELVRIDADDAGNSVELVHGAPVYRLRGRLLPLLYLRRELNLAPEPGVSEERSAAVNIVVLQADGRQFGLVVDAINDTEEIVVKPLRKQLTTVKTFAGSSIMGDGKVALILDVLGLAQRGGVIGEMRGRALAEKSSDSVAAAAVKQTFLLFAGPGDSRMAIPFPVAQVEMSGREWVTQYRGQILPLIRLNVVLEERRNKLRVLQALPEVDSGPIQVLVLNHGGRSFGLVVERILDIVEDLADVRLKATRAAVLYTVVIDGRVTELLDIPAILRRADSGPAEIAN
jgi:two-component system chemotaxis sensor kinase CheA